MTVTLLLQIIGLILLGMAGFNVYAPARVTWGWLGMFFWLLSLVLGGVAFHAIR